MIVGGKAAILGLLLAFGATEASASDRTGFASIAARDWSAAERTLLAERRIYPRRPELMINLAAVYAATGRDAEAAALYEQVLERPAVAMDTPSGEVRSSHALASAALRRRGQVVALNR